jgi:hypothetical protein
MLEHEAAQEAFHLNRERLKAERLACERETTPAALTADTEGASLPGNAACHP